MRNIKEWGTINWFSKSLRFRISEQAKVILCSHGSGENRVGKCSEKGNRNKRSFWAPARGRKVNIYCLPSSSFKFRQYLLFYSPSQYFHCLLLRTLRAITVNHLGDTLVHVKKRPRKPPGLPWLRSEITQHVSQPARSSFGTHPLPYWISCSWQNQAGCYCSTVKNWSCLHLPHLLPHQNSCCLKCLRRKQRACVKQ